MAIDDEEVAADEAVTLPLERLDPLEPRAAEAFAAVLAAPRDIVFTEAVEVLAKAMWEPTLREPTRTPEQSFRFSEFFATIGFFKKYKPYGTKFAAPFGYSLFALEPGKGFSVQLHKVAKVEAFHVLAVTRDSFVLLCDAREWEELGADFLASWENGAPANSNLVFEPAPGDVVVIDELGTVHSVVGCIVEEFATTSNDAVERIFDQNAGMPVKLPSRHPLAADVLVSCGEVWPRRQVWRQGAGWGSQPIGPKTSALVDLAEQGLKGSRLEVTPSTPARLRAGEGVILTLVCVGGSVRVALRGGTMELGVGETAPIAPGETVVLEAGSESARVVACSVKTQLAVGDFRGTGDKARVSAQRA